MEKTITIAGVTITHPDKILYPEEKVTKQDIAEYYEFIAPFILPELMGRPISMVRSPSGVDKVRFYQKHPSENFPSYIERISIEEKDGANVYITLDALNDLIFLANLGVLEFHTWGSALPDIEKPNRIIFDFDPDPAASWDFVLKGVQILKEYLDELKMKSFVKTSGIKGFHVVIPIKPEYSWEDAKLFAKTIGDIMSQNNPKMFTTEILKVKRKGLVFIDYLRNTRGATNVAAYSTRTYPNASVSLPIFWEEVTKVKPYSFTIKNIRDRLSNEGNPWKDYEKVAQSLPARK